MRISLVIFSQFIVDYSYIMEINYSNKQVPTERHCFRLGSRPMRRMRKTMADHRWNTGVSRHGFELSCTRFSSGVAAVFCLRYTTSVGEMSTMTRNRSMTGRHSVGNPPSFSASDSDSFPAVDSRHRNAVGAFSRRVSKNYVCVTPAV